MVDGEHLGAAADAERLAQRAEHGTGRTAAGPAEPGVDPARPCHQLGPDVLRRHLNRATVHHGGRGTDDRAVAVLANHPAAHRGGRDPMAGGGARR